MLLLFSLLVACGLKGPLKPLREPLPTAPAGFSLQQKGARILLSWGIPHQNQDGSPLTDLAGFRVYKMHYNPAEDCPECRDTSVLLREVDPDYLRGAIQLGNRLFLWDADLTEGLGYRYRVVPYTRSGFDGASAVAMRIFLPPPTAPTGVSAQPLDHQVRLTWTPPLELSPETLVGYNVYRRSADGSFSPEPLNPALLKKARFEDFTVRNGVAYHYAVRSVAREQKETVESALSAEVAATPRRGQ
jgi:hypothetical protein